MRLAVRRVREESRPTDEHVVPLLEEREQAAELAPDAREDLGADAGAEAVGEHVGTQLVLGRFEQDVLRGLRDRVDLLLTTVSWAMGRGMRR